MRLAKMVLVAGILGAFASASTLAIPLDITFTGGVPAQIYPGYSAYFDPGFQAAISVANAAQTSSFNLAGVNSITMTWSAPAGYMYVVNPPPAGLEFSTLSFEADYGSSGQASSLGLMTGSSFSVHTVYGTSPLSPNIVVDNGPAISLAAYAGLSATAAPWAFTSISISAEFSGTGAAQTLERDPADVQAELFGDYSGDFAFNGSASNGPYSYYIPPDPGPLLTLEPLPTGLTADASPTLSLAGLGFAGLFLFGLKRLCTLDV